MRVRPARLYFRAEKRYGHRIPGSTNIDGTLEGQRGLIVDDVLFEPHDKCASDPTPHEYAPFDRDDMHVKLASRQKSLRRFRKSTPARSFDNPKLASGSQAGVRKRLVRRYDATQPPPPFHLKAPRPRYPMWVETGARAYGPLRQARAPRIETRRLRAST